MRRTMFLALFAALLLVLPATAHAQSNETILRDCADDGMLERDYSASAMRKARNNMPAELDEYSDCRDVLSRAIAAKTAASNNNSGGSGGGGGNDAGGTGGGGGTADPNPAPEATAAPQATATPSGRDPGIQIGPSTPEDWEALRGANRYTTESLDINGRPVTPAASVGRNGLPGTIVAVLALLAAAAIAVTVPFVRRRVATRSSPT